MPCIAKCSRRAPSLRWETTVPTWFFRCKWLQKVERSNLWTLNIKKNTTTSPNLQCFSVWLYLFLLCLQAPVYSTITCSIWEKQQTSLAYCLENTALSWWDILLYTFACYLLYLSDLRRSVSARISNKLTGWPLKAYDCSVHLQQFPIVQAILPAANRWHWCLLFFQSEGKRWTCYSRLKGGEDWIFLDRSIGNGSS